MAGRGPAPDPNAVRRNATLPTQTIKSDGRVYGWDLPTDALKPGEQWHPVVVQWWEAWRRSPQATTMTTEPDWLELLACARLYQDFWTRDKGRTMLAAELRQRMAKFGATHEDRLRLRLTVEIPPPAIGDSEMSEGGGASVTRMDERRNRLGG